MFKKLIITAIATFGFVFMVSGSQPDVTECKLDNSQECWQYDNDKGWIYHAPVIEISADNENDNWTYDDDKGWIYNSPEIEITPDDDDTWSYDDDKGWVFHAEAITVLG